MDKVQVIVILATIVGFAFFFLSQEETEKENYVPEIAKYNIDDNDKKTEKQTEDSELKTKEEKSINRDSPKEKEKKVKKKGKNKENKNKNNINYLFILLCIIGIVIAIALVICIVIFIRYIKNKIENFFKSKNIKNFFKSNTIIKNNTNNTNNTNNPHIINNTNNTNNTNNPHIINNTNNTMNNQNNNINNKNNEMKNINNEKIVDEIKNIISTYSFYTLSTNNGTIEVFQKPNIQLDDVNDMPNVFFHQDDTCLNSLSQYNLSDDEKIIIFAIRTQIFSSYFNGNNIDNNKKEVNNSVLVQQRAEWLKNSKTVTAGKINDAFEFVMKSKININKVVYKQKMKDELFEKDKFPIKFGFSVKKFRPQENVNEYFIPDNITVHLLYEIWHSIFFSLNEEGIEGNQNIKMIFNTIVKYFRLYYEKLPQNFKIEHDFKYNQLM